MSLETKRGISPLYAGALFVIAGGFLRGMHEVIGDCLCLDQIGAEQSSNDDGA